MSRRARVRHVSTLRYAHPVSAPSTCRVVPTAAAAAGAYDLSGQGTIGRASASSSSVPQFSIGTADRFAYMGQYVSKKHARSSMREAAEAEVSAAALRVLWVMCLACDAACLPFGMVGELRRKLSPIALAVLLLFVGVGIMNIRVSAEFPCLRQRAAFRAIVMRRGVSVP